MIVVNHLADKQTKRQKKNQNKNSNRPAKDEYDIKLGVPSCFILHIIQKAKGGKQTEIGEKQIHFCQFYQTV